MNRRELLSTFGGLVLGSQTELAQVSAAEAVPAVDDRDRLPLRALLPKNDTLPGRFEAAMAIDEVVEGLGRSTGDVITTHYTQRTYTPGGESDEVGAAVQCEVHLLTDDAPDAELLASHHDDVLTEEFGNDEPSLDQFTDWVDATLRESRVNGDRRTVHWRELPVFYNPTDRDFGDHPTKEFAVTVETCSWGTIKITAYSEPRPRRRARDLVEHVLSQVSRTVRSSPTPISEATYERAQRWTRMTVDEREEVVVSAVRMLETEAAKAATETSLVEGLDDFYDADPTTTRHLLHRLEARGSIERSTDGTLSVT